MRNHQLMGFRWACGNVGRAAVVIRVRNVLQAVRILGGGGRKVCECLGPCLSCVACWTALVETLELQEIRASPASVSGWRGGW